jgi:hypothetical protein
MQRVPADPNLRVRKMVVSVGKSGFALGFGYWALDTIPIRMRMYAIPHWSVALVCALLPAFRAASLLRSPKRQSKGLCPECGYDLRATPDRCPECGTAAAADSSSSGPRPARLRL